MAESSCSDGAAEDADHTAKDHPGEALEGTAVEVDSTLAAVVAIESEAGRTCCVHVDHDQMVKQLRLASLIAGYDKLEDIVGVTFEQLP